MLTPEDDTTHFWGLASESVQLGSSVMARRGSASFLGIANFLYAVSPRSAGELHADLAKAASQGQCHRVVVESRTPPWVEAELLLRHWEVEHELRLVLDPGVLLVRSAPSYAVRRAVECDPTWSVRGEMFRLDHLEEDARHGADPRPPAYTAATIDHRRELERHATYYCAQRRGDVAGFLCTWRAPSGRGVIEDVFVHPDHRGHGVATSLLHHAVDVLLNAGTGRISIAAEVGGTPGQLYARLGFRPHRVARSCVFSAGDV